MLLTALEINHDMCNFDYRNESQFDTNIVELVAFSKENMIGILIRIYEYP